MSLVLEMDLEIGMICFNLKILLQRMGAIDFEMAMDTILNVLARHA